MSIVKLLNPRDRIVAVPLALIETAVFFCVLSSAYFLLVSLVYQVLAADELRLAVLDPGTWFGPLPAWLWIIEGGVYMLLVTVYWAPGERLVNDSEVLAFAIFLLLAALTFAVFNYDAVRSVGSTVWSAWTGQVDEAGPPTDGAPDGAAPAATPPATDTAPATAAAATTGAETSPAADTTPATASATEPADTGPATSTATAPVSE